MIKDSCLMNELCMIFFYFRTLVKSLVTNLCQLTHDEVDLVHTCTCTWRLSQLDPHSIVLSLVHRHIIFEGI